MKTLFIQLSVVTVMLGGLFLGAFHFSQPSMALGAYNPTGGGTYRLGQSIGTSDSSFKLSSFKEPVSNIPYTMSYLNSDIEYGTISPQSSISEFVSFSGITQNSDGSATLTGVVRGMSRTPGTGGCVASTTLAQSHAGQSIFILSNPPCQLAEYIPLRTIATSSAILVFSSTSPPRLDQPGLQSSGTYNATTSEFVTWAGLMAVTNAGTVNATQAVKGIIQLANSRTEASSTNLGSTGASNVLSAQYATDTPGTLCSSSVSCTVKALIGGKIRQTWLDLTENFTTSGTWVFNGAASLLGNTTIAMTVAHPLTLNGLAYTLNGSRQASSTVLSEDGSGNLSFATPAYALLISTTTSVAMSNATTTFAAANNLHIVVYIPGYNLSGICLTYNSDNIGTNYGYRSYAQDTNTISFQGNLQSMSFIGTQAATTTDVLLIGDIKNIAAKRKLGAWQMTQNAAASNIPQSYISRDVWNNTSAQITTFTLQGNGNGQCGSSVVFPAGTVIEVYGTN